MKQYRVDELRPEDYEKLKAHLDERLGPSSIDGIYWSPLDPDIMDEVQTAHVDCQPFYFAVALEPSFISFEFLIRTRKKMRCHCINYANERQRDSIMRFADELFEMLNILT